MRSDLLLVAGWALVLAGAAPAQSSGPASAGGQEKLRYYFHRTYGWHRLAQLGGETLVDHLLDGSDDWERGPDGYAMRLSDAFGRRVVCNSLELALSVAMREDARYQPSGMTGLRHRLWFAASHAFRARLPDGRTRLAYSRLGAIVAGTLVVSAWPSRRVSAAYVSETAAASVLDGMGNALLAEFTPDLRHFGSRVRRKIFGH